MVPVTAELINQLAVPQTSFNQALAQLFEQQPAGNYVLQKGDVLSIYLWAYPEITPAATNITPVNAEQIGFKINQEGNLSFPLIKQIRAQGKTVTALQRELNQRLSHYLKQPDAQIKVLQYKGRKFFVGGEVRLPGQYLISDEPVNLYGALNAAGGILNMGDLNAISLTRNGVNYQFGLLDLQKQGLSPNQLYIQNGDEIHILSRESRKIYFLGEAGQPAPLILREQGMSLALALAQRFAVQPRDIQQLKVVKASQIGNAHVVDPAILPLKPVQPKPLMVLILSIFLGGFVGVLLALLRNMLSSGVKDAENIEAQTSLPVYATLAHSSILDKFRSVRSKTLPLVALEDHEDLTLESLRSLRTVLYFAQRNAKNNVVLVTGPAPEVGKTFICANLVTILAQIGKIVLLIDADMRRGHMHKYFNADSGNGLADYLSGSKDLAARDIIQDTPVKGLSFVSKGSTPANPSELLLSPVFESFLKEISEHYDHVIIDSPPLLAVIDGIIISKYTGLNLLVARYGKKPIKEIKLCMSRLQHSGQKVHGLVLNDVPQGALQSEGYSYTYKYRSNS